MRSHLLFVPVLVVVFATGQVFAQAANTARLKINGSVKLSSSYAEIVKALGKPRRETKAKRDGCGGGLSKSLNYPGLSIYVMDGSPRRAKTYSVMGFDVTSRKYAVSGVRVGDSEATVKRKFGSKFTADTDSRTGITKWHYAIGERHGLGWTMVTFRKGKVVVIGSSYTLC